MNHFPRQDEVIMNHDPLRKTTRREALCQAGTGLGMLGLFGLLGDAGYLGAVAEGADVAGARPPVSNPLAPRASHFPAKAKHVIHIYLNGGPSQVDTFDPKPLLKKYEGKTLPLGNLTTERKTGDRAARPRSGSGSMGRAGPRSARSSPGPPSMSMTCASSAR